MKTPAATVHRSGISHMVLDIEGTTCPVSFVAETLFPYAARELGRFLSLNRADPGIKGLLEQAQQSWDSDSDPEAMALHQQPDSQIVDYLRLLIRQDRKLPALKELQGLIWDSGYARGELRSPLYQDVAPALNHWHGQGLILAVYSSGSIRAQQLLYQYSQCGDLRCSFSFWFDTRTGPKNESSSYTAIATSMNAKPCSILFISDALTECQAATQAGLQVLFSDRKGNPGRDRGPFESITDYTTLRIEPALENSLFP